MNKLKYTRKGAEMLPTSIFHNIKIDPDYTVHLDIPFYKFENFFCSIWENKECIRAFYSDDLQLMIKEINEIIEDERRIR